ncbi:MAG TPA: carboxypeptidase regulatory-like domain-containing protein [Vicinamibacterales bacterium]|jgi:hypothetical protein|nr:carboxypeptidase regulatory-like domain-containing protein [Vicinamibacterales bacterium]
MPRRLFGFVVLFAAVFMPNAADACTCFEQKVACEAAWDVDAVFVAQVVRVERAGERDLRVHLMPLETLRGPSNILSVNTARSESECGYLFQAGETYLIYASAEAGGYGAGLCSRTRRLSEAADDLEYLRTVARTPSNFGVVRGTVWRTDRIFRGPPQRNPYPGVRVFVRGNGVQEERETDARGRYEVPLPPGEYDVDVEAPEGLYPLSFRRARLRSARGCAEVDISLHSDGRIRGRVVDARGQPLGGLPLQLVVPVETGFFRVGDSIATASDGTYEFTRVPPGTFYVTFDTLRPDSSRPWTTQQLFAPGTLNPDAGEAIVLPPAARATAADFVLPDTAGVVRLTGQVRTAAGQPVPGAQVYLRTASPTARYFSGPPAVSDANGEFSMIVPGDADYKVAVALPGDDQPRDEQRTVRPAQGDRFIDIVIPAK